MLPIMVICEGWKSHMIKRKPETAQTTRLRAINELPLVAEAPNFPFNYTCNIVEHYIWILSGVGVNLII